VNALMFKQFPSNIVTLLARTKNVRGTTLLHIHKRLPARSRVFGGVGAAL